MCAQTARQQFGAEQLAYIAAIAVDAALIYGDVPKDVSFRRLLVVPTLRDLDESYARQSWLNYREILTGERLSRCMFLNRVGFGDQDAGSIEPRALSSSIDCFAQSVALQQSHVDLDRLDNPCAVPTADGPGLFASRPACFQRLDGR